jgi:hypothetical protein
MEALNPMKIYQLVCTENRRESSHLKSMIKMQMLSKEWLSISEKDRSMAELVIYLKRFSIFAKDSFYRRNCRRSQRKRKTRS